VRQPPGAGAVTRIRKAGPFTSPGTAVLLRAEQIPARHVRASIIAMRWYNVGFWPET
jgi:hypothetical protein